MRSTPAHCLVKKYAQMDVIKEIDVFSKYSYTQISIFFNDKLITKTSISLKKNYISVFFKYTSHNHKYNHLKKKS